MTTHTYMLVNVDSDKLLVENFSKKHFQYDPGYANWTTMIGHSSFSFSCYTKPNSDIVLIPEIDHILFMDPEYGESGVMDRHGIALYSDGYGAIFHKYRSILEPLLNQYIDTEHSDNCKTIISEINDKLGCFDDSVFPEGLFFDIKAGDMVSPYSV